MEWIIFSAILFTIIMLVIFVRYISNKIRLYTIKTWKVGDELNIRSKYILDILEKNSQKYALLKKWDEKEIIVDCGDNMNYLIYYDQILINISALWRERHKRMGEFMDSINENKPLIKKSIVDGKGNEVEVSEMLIETKSGEVFIDGRPLNGMAEVYLSIYQGLALKEEKYELLAKINKQLERFR